jgi:hypothetical protein
MEVTLCSNVRELKHHEIPEFIWVIMEPKLNKTKTVLKHFWYQRLHLQLFCNEPIYLNDIKIKLIK